MCMHCLHTLIFIAFCYFFWEVPRATGLKVVVVFIFKSTMTHSILKMSCANTVFCLHCKVALNWNHVLVFSRVLQNVFEQTTQWLHWMSSLSVLDLCGVPGTVAMWCPAWFFRVQLSPPCSSRGVVQLEEFLKFFNDRVCMKGLALHAEQRQRECRIKSSEQRKDAWGRKQWKIFSEVAQQVTRGSRCLE